MQLFSNHIEQMDMFFRCPWKKSYFQEDGLLWWRIIVSQCKGMWTQGSMIHWGLLLWCCFIVFHVIKKVAEDSFESGYLENILFELFNSFPCWYNLNIRIMLRVYAFFLEAGLVLGISLYFLTYSAHANFLNIFFPYCRHFEIKISKAFHHALGKWSLKFWSPIWSPSILT